MTSGAQGREPRSSSKSGTLFRHYSVEQSPSPWQAEYFLLEPSGAPNCDPWQGYPGLVRSRGTVRVGFGKTETVKYPEPSSRNDQKRMRAVGSRDTSPERALRSILHRAGYRFRVDIQPAPTLRRRADLVFTKARLAVFVDGCFWHGCPQHASWPMNNEEFWCLKIEGTRARDADTNEKLQLLGWRVLRFWEHEFNEESGSTSRPNPCANGQRCRT